jgi:TRAP-type C4-dicarboxylate transport system substrate-binding protein
MPMPGRLIIATLALFAAGVATAAPLQIKIATLAPENSIWMKEMRLGAKEIEERTEGRVTLKFYGGGVMGNDKKVLRKMRIGQLHGGSFTPSGLAERCPDLNLYGMPLVFDSLDEVDYVRARFDDRLMASLEDVGLVGFGLAGGGFAMIMSNTPVANRDDLRGRKVWVPEGDTWTVSAMRALDLSPVTLPITDVLTGLQTGLIEVIGTPPVAAVALQWYTKLKYLTDFPVSYTYAVLVIEKEVLDRAEPADQAVVKEVMDRIYASFDAGSIAENEGAMKALRSNDIQVVEPDAGAVQQWRGRVLASNRSNAEAGLISLALYEDMLDTLEEYRAVRGEKTAAEVSVH